jgi:hypothetical protein
VHPGTGSPVGYGRFGAAPEGGVANGWVRPGTGREGAGRALYSRSGTGL